MADEPLLSDLCSICNTTKSKYCCPGCSARTCSLPCYKRHQQWAQCSGKRDPTAYVKKSQLATPAGIDHDYNFLTSIERGLEKAERDVTSRGVITTPPEVKKGSKKGEIHPKVFESLGVTVIRAPKGLSRERENATSRNSKRNIVWTVEWIHPDKTRSLSKTSEKAVLWEAYREATGQPPYRKRKREPKDHHTAEGETSTSNKRQHDSTSEHNTIGGGCSGGDSEATQSISSEPQQSEPKPPTGESEQPSGEQSSIPTTEPQPAADKVAEADRPAVSPEPERLSSQFNFFLHRPRTSSSKPVLIPITATATLGECLRGHTVLEFPTIYAFTEPIPPQEQFVLEEEYLKMEEEEQKEFDAVMKDVKPETLRQIQNNGPVDEGVKVDESKILDVLKEDLGGLM